MKKINTYFQLVNVKIKTYLGMKIFLNLQLKGKYVDNFSISGKKTTLLPTVSPNAEQFVQYKIYLI